MGKRKSRYTVGAKQSVTRLISKKLDTKIKRKEKELKNKARDPNKITYLYASSLVGDEK